MKAIQIQTYGAPDVLHLTGLAKPTCKEDEVLIKVGAAGVNPIDYKVREGIYAEVFNHTLPLILGWDLAGTIESIGSKVNDFNVGDEVFGLVNFPSAGNCYAEYVAVKANEIYLKPPSLSVEQAAACPLVALTAWQCLFETGNLSKGEKVLIHAGAGGVGHVAIQLAKAKGAYVYATCSQANHEFVSSLGADQTVDYKNTNFENEVSDLDLVFDTVGGDIPARSFATLKQGGRLISIAAQITPELQQLADQKQINASWQLVHPSQEQLKEIFQLAESGDLNINVSEIIPYQDVMQAHEKMSLGRTKGKIVLTF
jgi:NADPH:quinone reductase-like Zn-dependent oxidoreductase